MNKTHRNKELYMSNAFHFSGRLSLTPVMKEGDKVLKFTLLRNEPGRRGEEGGQREMKTISIQFTAFNQTAEQIAKHCRKGDQLIIDSHIENNNYTDANQNQVYGFSFIVDKFEFGAPGSEKRQELESRQQQ
ncbi:single-stranded DNA-binding protein [Escherichia coli]|uniref:single-stranded DNA-binding protein n=2 Tax=Enterobacteriaceae TaxID=543 RepID=UPI00191C898D|nr:single-stranded DNA-binding protein [Escherichia coli]